MKITYASDLHLEFGDLNPPQGDVLVLAGDVLVVEHLFKQGGPRKPLGDRYRTFLEGCSNGFNHVVVVMGNHEFYGGRWVETIHNYREVLREWSNIYLLERDLVQLGDITFVGGTLWTDQGGSNPLVLHAARDLMTDYREITVEHRGWTKLLPQDTVTRYRETLDYLNLVVQGRDRVVVVTHHAPTHLSVHPYYQHSVLNHCYHSNLDSWILDHPQVQVWIHGHTHHPHHYRVGGTLVVCNPRGYHNHEDLANHFQFKDLTL